MKKALFMGSALIIILSCSITREERFIRVDHRQQEKLSRQAMVKEAVETRRFRIKLTAIPAYEERIYPEAITFIVDADTLKIEEEIEYNLPGYSRVPISMEIFEYKLTADPDKEGYVIEMRCKSSVNLSFGEYIYLLIKNDGACRAILHSVPLSQIYFNYSSESHSHSGQLEPLKQ
jgi:hypothetical protein